MTTPDVPPLPSFRQSFFNHLKTYVLSFTIVMACAIAVGVLLNVSLGSTFQTWLMSPEAAGHLMMGLGIMAFLWISLSMVPILNVKHKPAAFFDSVWAPLRVVFICWFFIPNIVWSTSNAKVSLLQWIVLSIIS